MIKRRQSQSEQSGFVSLIVVSVLAIVLALVSLGFSRLMDRELRQSLDRQLAAQAYYSAEAGLNDAQAYLLAGGTSFSGCANWPGLGDHYFVNDLSNGQQAAKYSCVSVDATPNQLVYPLQAGQSVVFKVDLNNLGKFYFGWENQSYSNGPAPLGTCSGSGCTLPREDTVSADATGVLRTSIYPVPHSIPGSVSNTNDYLSYLARTYFLYPNASGSAGTFGSESYGNNGTFVHGDCNSDNDTNNYSPTSNTGAIPRYCNAAISGLDGTDNYYYLRLTAQYAALNITVQATSSADNDALTFSNVQGLVDVTGSGSDVLQRIQARVNLSNQYNEPSYGLQSMVAICKAFRVYVPSLGTYGDVIDPGLSVDNSDGACASPSGGGSVDPDGGLGPLAARSCPAPYSGTEPSCSFSCPANSHLVSGTTCVCNSGYTGTPPSCVRNAPPPAPSINYFNHNFSNSFTYNVSNASSCTVFTDNPSGGQQNFSPSLGGNFGVTAGNGGSGSLQCSGPGGTTPRVRATGP